VIIKKVKDEPYAKMNYSLVTSVQSPR